MKKNQPPRMAYWILSILLFILLSVQTHAQINGLIPGTEAYQSAKAALVAPNQRTAIANATLSKPVVAISSTPFSSDEDACYIPHDPETWTVWTRNDDLSVFIELPFSFEFYGEFYTGVWLNNNGNLTLDDPLSTFSAFGFPFVTPMIAPFWGDVDTRNVLSEIVWYQITPTALYVNWPGVGYYDREVDLINTFQVIITDSNDPVIGVGNNIGFHYQDMQWTTGEASDGVGGFGGVAATVGINGGGENSATNFFQVGRFRQPGDVFLGPQSTQNGIDFLDDACFYFNVTSGTNIPPVLLQLSSTSQTLCPGQTAEIAWTFSGPEPLQNVMVSLTDDPLGTSSSLTQTVFGSTASGILTLEANATGNYLLTLTATDDGDPIKQTTQNITLVVLSCDCDDVPGGSNIPGADCSSANGAPGLISENCECVESTPGCTNPNAINFNINANVDDGSCIFDSGPIPGCTDASANNYNPDATEDNGSCTYDPIEVPGCTDPEALNYDPDATEDDGSCIYDTGDGCFGHSIIEYVQGTKLNGSPLDADRTDENQALGEPDRVNAVGGFVSLGYGGSISIAFDGAVTDLPGDDILVWETSFNSDNCLSDGIEAAQIELSQNGTTWVPAGMLCRDGAIDIAVSGLAWITAIKIINDASSGTFDGYDVDGVEAINGCGPVPVDECFGSEVLSYIPGPKDNGTPITDPQRIDPTKALGAPQLDNSFNFVSLGYGGELIVGFDGVVLNGAGPDILVVETTFGNQTFASYPESADVFVTQNGINYFLVGSLTTSQVGLFDIDDAGQGFDYITAVKVVDTTPEGSVSEDGFDVDAVEAINGCTQLPSILIGQCYATEAVQYIQGTKKNGSSLPVNRTDANQALGEPEGTDALVFVTLGYGGSIILGFDGSVLNGPGADLEMVETTFGSGACATYPEYADVYVSQNGINFFPVGTVCKTDNTLDIDDAGQGFTYITYVKIVNNDVLTTTPDGYDLDGVRAIHNCEGEDRGNSDGTISVFANERSRLGTQPNPTSGPSTAIFSVENTAYTTLEIYDMNGRNISTLFNQVANAGQEYRIEFDGSVLPNGVYLYRMTTENEVIVEKFMIAR